MTRDAREPNMQPSRDSYPIEIFAAAPPSAPASRQKNSDLDPAPSALEQAGGGPAAAGANDAREQEKLLLEVIEVTLRGESDTLNDAEWEAICRIARSRGSCPLDLAILTEFVAAFLSQRFAALAEDPQLVQRMSLRISGSLWSHAASKLRLQKFWEQLQEHVR